MGHQFKKHFGQNFLQHQSIANKIASFLSDTVDFVIEIGPGDGKLTQALLERDFEVYSIEIDDDLYEKLETRFRDFPKFHLIKADVLNFQLSTLNLSLDNYAVTGNLPYNISKKIIQDFLETENAPKEMIFMIQREVAKDYTAKPPQSSFLSNYASVFSEAKYLLTVKKEQFKPKPKVDGGVVRFTQRSNSQIQSPREFVRFLREGFSAPRKTLTNALKKYDKEKLLQFFKENNLSDKSRAAELEFNHWVELYNSLSINIS